MSGRRKSASDSHDHAHQDATPATGRSVERAVSRIVDATSSLVGERFMNVVVSSCATTLGAAYAFITETTADPNIRRMVALWNDGSVVTDIPYRVAGAPAGDGRADLTDGNDIATRFPGLTWAEGGTELFAGVPLHAEGGELIGELGVLARHADLNLSAIDAVLRAVAPRVEGELEQARLIRGLTQRGRELHALVEHVNDVFLRLELMPQPRLTYISPAVERLTGYAADAFISDPFLFLRLFDPPQDRKTIGRLVREHAGPINARWKRKDGSSFWMEYSDALTFGDGGRLVAIDAVIRDVTERVVLEEQLRAAQERERDVITALPDLVFRVGVDGATREYFEAENMPTPIPPSEFVGRNVAEIWPKDRADRVLRLIRDAIETRTTQRFDYFTEIDGEQRYRESRIVPISEQEVLAFVRDFTAERRMAEEDEQRAARDDLESRVESRMDNGGQYGLTFRELTVLHHLSNGLADKEIAEALGISAYTVNKHVASILSKMRASSRTAAGVRAVREGLVT